MMGRWVAVSAAAYGSPWAQRHADQRLMNSCAVALLSCLLLLYGVSGIVFGYLPIFVLDGFLPAQGVPALLVSLGSLSMAVGLGSHLVQRHWSTATRERCMFFRREAWLFGWLCVALAVAALMLMILGDIHALNRPLGLQPDSDWMLAPLPWLWRYMLPLAREKVTVWLIVWGLGFVFAMLLFRKLRWRRPFFFSIGMVTCAAGGYFLGDSAYAYAASRGLKGIVDPDAAQAWRSNPGLFNAWVWLDWWVGLSMLALGVLQLALSISLPADVMNRINLPD